MPWETVVTSAAVGALMATLGQLVGQMLERRYRRREAIFRFSVEAARANREDALLAREETPPEQRRALRIPDPLYLAGDYYPLVERLFEKGRHPREIKAERPSPSDPAHPSGLR